MRETNTKKHIEVDFSVKQKFDKLQADLKYKGCSRTKSELVLILINTFKKFNIQSKGKKLVSPQDNSSPCLDTENKK